MKTLDENDVAVLKRAADIFAEKLVDQIVAWCGDTSGNRPDRPHVSQAEQLRQRMRRKFGI